MMVVVVVRVVGTGNGNGAVNNNERVVISMICSGLLSNIVHRIRRLHPLGRGMMKTWGGGL